ncbi:hypothetical protein FQA47_016180 [Oryzias melastigma]|uniref:Uncharacterized protein n=1 Tax=Oryzias melastigma TaxID=30732 RepID=A0A834L1R2_ORYME|nr:hypothetical protein FQA47_016180 [Oryzias melastigma]
MSKKLKKILDLLDNKIPNHESHVAAPQKGLRSVQSEATEELKPSRADSPPRLQDPQLTLSPAAAQLSRHAPYRPGGSGTTFGSKVKQGSRTEIRLL